MELRTGAVVYWAAAVAVLVLAIAGTASYRSLQELRTAELRVLQSRDIELVLERLLADLQDAEASERGYLLVATDALLAPFDAARLRIRADLRQLGELVVDDPLAGPPQRALAAGVDAHLELAGRAVAARRAGASFADLATLTASGEQQADRLRAAVGALQAAERGVLAVRRARAARARTWSSAAAALLGGLAIALVVVLLAVARRDARELQRSAIRLRRLERERAASEERFRRIADAMPQIVYVTDEQSRVEYLNRRWAEYTGADDPAPPLTEPAIHVDDRAALAAAWEAARATETPLEAQLRLRDRAGGWRWFLTRAVPFRDPESGALRWYGTSTDIDAQVRAGEALAEADRRKDEFLATLSHELRNPLAPIRNAAQLLRAPQATPAERLWASEVIDRQVRTMAILLDDLLDVSRITRGTIVLERRRVTARSIVEAASEVARPLIEARRHALAVAGDLEVELEADPVRLTQALGNLLNNAAKYSDPGGRIELSVAAREVELEFAVRDHGVGLEPADLARVFGMFAQVNATRDRSDGGLGIGLALVKGLVKLHGGRVEASSAGLGKGAEFRMLLPRPARAAPASAPALRAPPGATAAESPGAGDGVAGVPLKVLVADDNRDGAQALARVLELAGHEVAVATDGAEALAQAEARRPEVVLLDIGMPQLSGYEVARRLRARDWGRELLLVAITGWGQAEDRRRSRESGFDHHLVKPVEAARLLGLIASRRPAVPP